MAEFTLNGRTKVKTLKAEFKKNWNATLRVYNGVKFADDDATLASIRQGDAKGGELKVAGNIKVGNFEEKMKAWLKQANDTQAGLNKRLNRR